MVGCKDAAPGLDGETCVLESGGRRGGGGGEQRKMEDEEQSACESRYREGSAHVWGTCSC